MSFGSGIYTQIGARLFQDVYAEADPNKNVVFSPSAAQGALIPVALGLTNPGAVERAKYIYGDDLTQGTKDVWSTILQNLSPRGAGEAVVVADSQRWDSTLEKVNPEFFKAYKEVFGRAPAERLDFCSPSAVNTINEWTRTATEGKVGKLFDELSKETKFVSVGTTYFKAPWEVQFDPKRTKPMPFETDTGRMVTVPTMNLSKAQASFMTSRDFTYISIPFKDGYDFFVVEPGEGRTLDDTVRQLPPILEQVQRTRLRKQEFSLSIPKISIASTDNLTPAFSKGLLEPVFKSDNFGAIQSVGFDINEEGGEAYAAVAMFVTRGISMTNHFALNKASVVGIGSNKNPHEPCPLFLVALRNPALG